MLLKAVKHLFSSAKPKRTFLYDFHLSLGAKMVEFAGYEMPVNYKDGVLKEHLFCREKSGLFDVSHMGQIKIRGKDAQEFVEKLCVADVKGLNPNNSSLSLILNEKAGIIDDTIVTKFADHM
jgi:aminomethyltransferase